MQDNFATIVARLHPLRSEVVRDIAAAGQSVAEIVEDMAVRHGVGGQWQQSVYVEIDGVPVAADRFALTVIGPNARMLVQFRVPQGGGGKNPLATILSIVVMAVAPQIGGALAGMMKLSGAALTFATGLATAGTMMLGNMLVGALVPPRPLSAKGLGHGSSEESDVYSITGMRNYHPHYKALPMVLGRVRFAPPYGALPYTRLAGNDQYLHCCFVWGAGELEISELKIGETPIEQFEGVEIATNPGTAVDPGLRLYPDDVYEESVGAALLSSNEVIRTTLEGTELISVDVVFPTGLFMINSKGKRTATEVVVEGYYRKLGAANWLLSFRHTFSSALATPLRRTFSQSVKGDPGQYEVRLLRITADKSPGDDRLFNDCSWALLRSIKYQDPVSFPAPAAETQLVIKATDQLNGIVDTFNGVVRPVCLDWDRVSRTWIRRATLNPASLYRLVYQGPGSAKPLPDQQLDLPALAEWHEFCDDNGFTYNKVHDGQMSVQAVILDICHAGRASFVLLDDLRSVVIDRERTLGPVQLFTTENSTGFSCRKTFVDAIHGYRVSFNNEEVDFQEDELTVYAEGYHAGNATLFEALEFPGVTTAQQAARLAKYHLATRRYRPELFTWQTDWEHLACGRGDLVRLSHPAILVAMIRGRVKAVNAITHTIAFDQAIVVESGKHYGVAIRTGGTESEYGQVFTLEIVALPGKTDTFTWSGEAPIAIGKGDLYSLGLLGKETIEVIVTGKVPTDDLRATLTGVPYSWPQIEGYLAGSYPDYNSTITRPSFTPAAAPMPPSIDYVMTGIAAGLVNADGTITQRIVMQVSIPSNGRVIAKEVQAEINTDDGWQRSSNSDPLAPIIFEGVEPGEVQIRVRSVADNGMVSAWVFRTITQEQARYTPDPITSLTVIGNLFQNDLSWTLPDDYRPHYKIEIWCASGVNDRASSYLVATLSGGSQWAHTGLDPQVDYFYWLRVIDNTELVSDFYPLNPTGGIGERPVSDPERILDLLTGSVTEGQLVAALNAKIDSSYTGITSLHELLQNQWTVKIQQDGVGGYYATGMGLVLYPDWMIATFYPSGSYVWDAATEDVYRAKLDHTSTTLNAPPYLGVWELIAHGAKSQIAFQADQFAVVNAASGGRMVPFVITGSTVGINGQLIVTGSITSDSLATHDTITWTVRSQNYSPGTAGFIIDAETGFAEFNNISVSFNYETPEGAQSKADAAYDAAKLLNAYTENGVTFIRKLGGGSYSSNSSSITGAIKITLPQRASNTMLKFKVDVFNYLTSTAFTLIVSGYNYTTTWTQCSVQLIGSAAGDNAVRYGNDGAKDCIWIGETASSWAYLKVTVYDLQAGYSNFAISQWESGWAVSVVTAFATVNAAFTDSMVDAKATKYVGNSLATDIETRANDPAARINAHTTTIHGGKLTTYSVDANRLNVSYLSAISGSMGTLTAGMARSANSMRYMNLDATGTGLFLCCRDDSGNYGMYVRANGDAYFAGTLKAGIVDTDTLAGNAASNAAAYYLASSLTLSTSEQTVASATIAATSGIPVYLAFNAVHDSTDTYSGDNNPTALVTLRVFRGATLIRTYQVFGNGSPTIALTDTPGAGSFTYYVKGYRSQYVSASMSYRSLYLQSLKR